MAARDHINPQQLPMFMDAVSIQENVTGSVEESRYFPPSEELWDEKLAEAKHEGGPNPSLYSQIRRNGVEDPVTLIIPGGHDLIMGQGHHRVAAAAHIQRKTGKTKYVPIIHDYDDMNAGDKWGKE